MKTEWTFRGELVNGIKHYNDKNGFKKTVFENYVTLTIEYYGDDCFCSGNGKTEDEALENLIENCQNIIEQYTALKKKAEGLKP